MLRGTLHKIDRALKSAYPTGIVADLDAEALDTHLQLDDIPQVVDRMSGIPGSNVVVQMEVVKTHVLHIGRDSYPDWQALNRDFSDSRRKAAIIQAGGEITYWNILLSRVGPFWMSYWNTFRIHNGSVVPRISDTPTDADWVRIVKGVRAELGLAGLSEVDKGLRDVSIPWLRSNHQESALSRPSTVFDGLFSELY